MKTEASEARKLLSAARNGYLDYVEGLLDAGCSPNVVESTGYTPLIEAASSGHEAVVKLLLRSGADPNARVGDTGHTALMLAAQKGHVSVIRALVAAGGDVNARDNRDKTLDEIFPSGRSAFRYAADSGQIAAMQELLSAGGGLVDMVGTGVMLLFESARFLCQLPTITFLMARAADQKDDLPLRERQLILAVAKGDVQVVQALLSRGKIDVDVTGTCGGTPLLYAVAGGHVGSPMSHRL